MLSQQELKRMAAGAAVELVNPGTIIGLGSGSTSEFAIRRIAELHAAGKLDGIKGIPSSERSAEIATELGIPLTTFDDNPQIDIAIDGADEVDSSLNLIKGGGGALLREKIVFQASRYNVVVVDKSKISKYLGEKWGVPVEIIPFSLRTSSDYLRSIGGDPELRRQEDGSAYRTDQQNYILDTNFGLIKEPARLAMQIIRFAGIVEHGIFFDLAHKVIVAAEDGIETYDRQHR